MGAQSSVENGDNGYILEDSEAELARLIRQAELFTRYEGGLFSERTDQLTGIERMLDLACGPGGWVLQVATAYPDIDVIGIDINARMIEYARSRARARNCPNARFILMDMTEPLEFPDDFFDLVNMRFLHTVLNRTTWPQVIDECWRVLRPGGSLRVTECEFAASNMPAANRLWHLLPESLYKTGRSFSPDGQSMGIAYMVGQFLRTRGYVHVRNQAFAIDYSMGTEAYERFTQHTRVTFSPHLLGRYLLTTGVMQPGEYEELYEKALQDMVSDQFCALACFLTVMGEKPAS